MSFTPIRDAGAYALNNVTTGAVISAANVNGLGDAMSYLANRGTCSIAASGQRVNDKVIPVIGLAYPDLGTFKTDIQSIAIPFTLPPNYNRFSLFYFFRLQAWLTAATAHGGKLTISIAKAGIKYKISEAIWTEYLSPFREGSKIVSAALPLNLTLASTSTEQLYLVIDLSYAATLDGTDDESLIGADIGAFPALSTYWNGLFSLRFAVWKDCGNC